jgi:hypothetical protein
MASSSSSKQTSLLDFYGKKIDKKGKQPAQTEEDSVGQLIFFPLAHHCMLD